MASKTDWLSSSVDSEEEGNSYEELYPTEWNTMRCGNFLEVSQDKYSVAYVGSGGHSNDVGTIQSNFSIPRNRSIYYFEIKIESAGLKGKIGIGFTEKGFRLGRQPGWESNSYGYHGDDGQFFRSSGHGEAYGPPFSTGDYVGAGINLNTQELFFTKNGKFLGIACGKVSGELFPTVGLHSTGERVEANFDRLPFKFNIEMKIQEEKDRKLSKVRSVVLPPNVTHDMVRSYLGYYGYKKTLLALDNVNSSMDEEAFSSLPQKLDFSETMEERATIRTLICSGDIDSAMAKISEWCPQILMDKSTGVNFILQTQMFLEIVKSSEIELAVDFARSALSQFKSLSQKQEKHLQTCLALLAYENPNDSPIGNLLDLSQRDEVADCVNRAILNLNDGSSDVAESSLLEKALKQLKVCHSENRVLDGNQGDVFRLKPLIRTSGELC